MQENNSLFPIADANGRLMCTELWGGIRSIDSEVSAGQVIGSIYSTACCDGGMGEAFLHIWPYLGSLDYSVYPCRVDRRHYGTGKWLGHYYGSITWSANLYQQFERLADGQRSFGSGHEPGSCTGLPDRRSDHDTTGHGRSLVPGYAPRFCFVCCICTRSAIVLGYLKFIIG